MTFSEFVFDIRDLPPSATQDIELEDYVAFIDDDDEDGECG